LCESEENTITFSTQYGKANAIWEEELPQVGCEYHVEIEIVDTIIWGNNGFETKDKMYTISWENEIFFITGYLESVEEDGYSVLRLGESIIPFVIDGKLPPADVYVQLQCKTVKLNNINY
jgi:hypothetical protein